MWIERGGRDFAGARDNRPERASLVTSRPVDGREAMGDDSCAPVTKPSVAFRRVPLETATGPIQAIMFGGRNPALLQELVDNRYQVFCGDSWAAGDGALLVCSNEGLPELDQRSRR